jgi:hypothetical protein
LYNSLRRSNATLRAEEVADHLEDGISKIKFPPRSDQRCIWKLISFAVHRSGQMLPVVITWNDVFYFNQHQLKKHALAPEYRRDCSAVQCSSVQCIAVQCSAVQCSAVRYTAVSIVLGSPCMSLKLLLTRDAFESYLVLQFTDLSRCCLS